MWWAFRRAKLSVILERFTLAADGSRLDYTLAVTDPVNFTEPVILEKHWLYHPEITVRALPMCQVAQWIRRNNPRVSRGETL